MLRYFTVTAILCGIISIRYFLVAGLFYWALWMRKPALPWAKKLYRNRPPAQLIYKEIYWSLLSSLIFALPGTALLILWENGNTAIYTDIHDFGVLYLIFSVGIYLFIHDTYFYWTHRWMHYKQVFSLFHKVHHESKEPSPWAAFSFHPLESAVGALIVPLLALWIPIHVGALLFILTVMTVCSVINHAGWEIFPPSWIQGFFGRHLISATHHNVHHAKYRYNYGLYFRFWDKVMGTDQMPSNLK